MAPISCCSSKAISPRLWPKPSSCCPAIFPPQARSVDKGHGRIEQRDLWCQPVTPATLGLAGAAQVIRVDRHVETIRRGQVIKQTSETAYACTSFWPDESTEQGLLDLVRSHWTIENG